MLLFHHSGFHDRGKFGSQLNAKGLTGIAVEVGTHRGEFASMLLSKWAGKKLFAIDNWEPDYHPNDPTAKGDREADFEAACAVARAHYLRMFTVRFSSLEASNFFQNESLDFCYIDANHSYEAVVEDLDLWWPKVKPGGWLAGHDIICPGDPQAWGEGVQKAAMQFANRHNRTIYLVPETLSWPWSYYFIKP